MIKRTYFYSATRWREDGRGESWEFGIVERRSWLPDQGAVMKACRDMAKEGFDRRQPGNTQPIRLVAFNRV